jgi:uncharacterized DUF497 family protein
MRDDRFEWSDAKARANLRKHEVSFEAARLAFDDPAGIDEIDDREDYGEARFIIRIVSARKATRREQDSYFSQGL